MSTATTTNPLERLAAVHPHHVTRIAQEAAALTPGTVLRANRGEFYCGFVAGDVVVVTSNDGLGYTLQDATNPGAHLRLSSVDDVTTMPVVDWTYEQIKAGQAAAERHAVDLLERAYVSANRMAGAPGTDQAALDTLHEARRIRQYAFALSVYATYVRGF
jgi:hypothetical protein